ncbi:MAG: hypothetical protein Q7S70_00270 [bacterium]|nr:hypothetical protein [bacterium]
MATKAATLEGELIQTGFVAKEELASAKLEIERTGEKLIRILARKKLISLPVLSTILSFYYDVFIFNLDEITAQPEALRSVPVDIAKTLNVLPFSLAGNVLSIVVEDPGDREAISLATGLDQRRLKLSVSVQGWEALAERIAKEYSERPQ